MVRAAMVRKLLAEVLGKYSYEFHLAYQGYRRLGSRNVQVGDIVSTEFKDNGPDNVLMVDEIEPDRYRSNNGVSCYREKVRVLIPQEIVELVRVLR